MRAIPALLAAALFMAPATGHAQLAPLDPESLAPPPPVAAGAAAELVDRRLLVAAVGAVAGVVAFNVLTGPFATVPLAGGVLAPVPIDIALGSRILAVASGTAGAMLGTVVHGRVTGQSHDYGRVLAIGAGALAGVAAGNLLTAGRIGVLPYYVGAGEAVGAAGGMASPAAQAASRIVVVSTGALGAIAGNWLYGLD